MHLSPNVAMGLKCAADMCLLIGFGFGLSDTDAAV